MQTKWKVAAALGICGILSVGFVVPSHAEWAYVEEMQDVLWDDVEWEEIDVGDGTEVYEEELEEESPSGQCGDNLYYELDRDMGVLTIEGDGTLWDYETYADLPWARYYADIKNTVLPDGARMKIWEMSYDYAERAGRLGDMDAVFAAADEEENEAELLEGEELELALAETTEGEETETQAAASGSSLIDDAASVSSLRLNNIYSTSSLLSASSSSSGSAVLSGDSGGSFDEDDYDYAGYTSYSGSKYVYKISSDSNNDEDDLDEDESETVDSDTTSATAAGSTSSSTGTKADSSNTSSEIWEEIEENEDSGAGEDSAENDIDEGDTEEDTEELDNLEAAADTEEEELDTLSEGDGEDEGEDLDGAGDNPEPADNGTGDESGGEVDG